MDDNLSEANKCAFDPKVWRERFDRFLSVNRRASQSLNRLLKLGLDKEQFMSLLPLACDFEGSPGYEAFQWILGPATEAAKKAKALARHQNKSRKEIVEFWQSDESKELLNALDAYRGYLKAVTAEMRQIESRRPQIPCMFLSWLITDVEVKTGRPRYSEVCDLLEIAYSAHEQTIPETGPDALRKTVKRFQQIDPVPWFFDRQALACFFMLLIVAAALQKFEWSEQPLVFQ